MPLTNTEYLMTTPGLERKAERLRQSDKPYDQRHAKEIEDYLEERAETWKRFKVNGHICP